MQKFVTIYQDLPFLVRGDILSNDVQKVYYGISLVFTFINLLSTYAISWLTINIIHLMQCVISSAKKTNDFIVFFVWLFDNSKEKYIT